MPPRAGRDLFYIHFLEVYSQIKDSSFYTHSTCLLVPLTWEFDYLKPFPWIGQVILLIKLSLMDLSFELFFGLGQILTCSENTPFF